MKYQIALFDLDGTVTDSGPGIVNSVHSTISTGRNMDTA